MGTVGVVREEVEVTRSHYCVAHGEQAQEVYEVYAPDRDLIGCFWVDDPEYVADSIRDREKGANMPTEAMRTAIRARVASWASKANVTYDIKWPR